MNRDELIDGIAELRTQIEGIRQESRKADESKVLNIAGAVLAFVSIAAFFFGGHDADHLPLVALLLIGGVLVARAIAITKAAQARVGEARRKQERLDAYQNALRER